jgi:hypothetical protein
VQLVHNHKYALEDFVIAGVPILETTFKKPVPRVETTSRRPKVIAFSAAIASPIRYRARVGL